jgi:type I restriction enzyme S subunit
MKHTDAGTRNRVRLRYLAQLNPSKTETADIPKDTAVSFLPMEAVGENGELDLSQQREIGAVETGYTYLRDGDVAYAKITPCFENGKAAEMAGLTEGIAFGTTELTVLRPRRDKCHGRFLYWVIKSPEFLVSGEATMTGAGGQKRVPDNFARNFEIACPPLPEQRAIAAFLDRETAKIDALVEEQRRLIALLKEKRQAVISQAVTRGLDPTAPLKPSGIDWLGNIPAHWEMKRVKHLVIENQGLQIGPFGGMLKDLPDHETKFKLYGQENTISGDFTKGNRWVEADRFEELKSYAIKGGDLVLTRKGSIGNCQIFPTGALPGIIDSDTIRVRIDKRVASPAYVQTCFQEADCIAIQLDLTKRGAILSGLNSSVVANLGFPLPPLSEQQALLDFLSQEKTKYDTLTAEAERAIALLTERRAALISAAVTGKIDLRETTDPTRSPEPVA